MSFAGFIITYNRPEVLLNTIKAIFEQSFPPEKIWIIDNSDGNETEILIKELLNSYSLEYIRMGFNAGPAGAAAKGLKLAASEGYDWIYWGDDNDPPPFEDTFEKLFFTLESISDFSSVGQIGMVGHLFNEKLGQIKKIESSFLKNKDFLMVDNIGGGQIKIINKNVVVMNILPDDTLFFGFEELSFDLRLKKAGFISLVNGKYFYSIRENYGRLNSTSKKVKTLSSLWRQYYSSRNLLFILKENSLYTALTINIFKNIFRPFMQVLKGNKYFLLSFHYNFLATYHFLINKRGKYFRNDEN